MTNDENSEPTGSPGQSGAEAWREIGQQFQALGESLAAALRAGWQSERTRRQLQELQSGLEAMADEVSGAVKEAASSARAHRVRGQVERATHTARSAGDQALQEVRPQLLNALRQVNTEVKKMIDRLDQTAAAVSEEEAPGSDEDAA
jgi:ElaB/YqjD/DUF883 family membrane-anchored ribosome-binding protein